MTPTVPKPLPQLTESLRNAPILHLKDYNYFVHPLTDGVPLITRELLEEAADALSQFLPSRFDRFLAPEAMGIPLAAALTLKTGRPFTVARKRAYGLPGEVTVPYRTGYSQGAFHVNGLSSGQRIVLVDDVASQGGTLRALAQAIQRAGAHLETILLLFNKGLDLPALSQELGCPVHALLTVRVHNGTVQVVP